MNIAPLKNMDTLSDIAPLDEIANLDSNAFLQILQSILQSHMGKYSPHAHTWVEPHIFANQNFTQTHCNKEDIASIAKVLTNMFNLEEATPSTTECFGNFAEDMYKKWRETSGNVTFFTSGSTGKPKPCTHPEIHLRQELMGILPLFKNRKRALVTAPLQHLFGFTFGLLLPLSLKIPIRLEAPIPTAIAHQIRENDLVMGVPLLFTHMAKLDNLQSKNSSLLTGTAPFADEVFEHLLALGFQVLECFGSSEMGVMCRRLKPRSPFTLLPQFNRIMHTESTDLPDMIRRTLPDGSIQDFALQDNIKWQDDRHLFPQGRKDFAVQVAGVNVFPEYVERILNEHPAVECCTVRLMRKEEGQRLKAFIVPANQHDEEELRKELRNYVKQKLKPEEQPARFDLGAEIPRSNIGKPTDW